MAQHRNQFVLQETSHCGQKMMHYRRTSGVIRARSEDRQTTLARSKSMDMVAMANRTDDTKRRVSRASSVSRMGDSEGLDWREHTPFLSPRRAGRKGDRTSWGLDDQGPIFQVGRTVQRTPPPPPPPPPHHHHNGGFLSNRRSGRLLKGLNPPPLVPTLDYPPDLPVL